MAVVYKKGNYDTAELIEIASQLKQKAEERSVYNGAEKTKRDIEIKYHRQMLVYLKAKFNQEEDAKKGNSLF